MISLLYVYLLASIVALRTFTNISIVGAQVSNILPDTYSLYGTHYAHVATYVVVYKCLYSPWTKQHNLLGFEETGNLWIL